MGTPLSMDIKFCLTCVFQFCEMFRQGPLQQCTFCCSVGKWLWRRWTRGWAREARTTTSTSRGRSWWSRCRSWEDLRPQRPRPPSPRPTPSSSTSTPKGGGLSRRFKCLDSSSTPQRVRLRRIVSHFFTELPTPLLLKFITHAEMRLFCFWVREGENSKYKAYQNLFLLFERGTLGNVHRSKDGFILLMSLG